MGAALGVSVIEGGFEGLGVAVEDGPVEEEPPQAPTDSAASAAATLVVRPRTWVPPRTGTLLLSRRCARVPERAQYDFSSLMPV